MIEEGLIKSSLHTTEVLYQTPLTESTMYMELVYMEWIPHMYMESQNTDRYFRYVFDVRKIILTKTLTIRFGIWEI